MYENSIFNYYVEMNDEKIIKNSNNQNVISIPITMFEKIQNKYFNEEDEIIKGGRGNTCEKGGRGNTCENR